MSCHFESKKTQGLKYGRALWFVVADKWAGSEEVRHACTNHYKFSALMSLRSRDNVQAKCTELVVIRTHVGPPLGWSCAGLLWDAKTSSTKQKIDLYLVLTRAYEEKSACNSPRAKTVWAEERNWKSTVISFLSFVRSTCR